MLQKEIYLVLQSKSHPTTYPGIPPIQLFCGEWHGYGASQLRGEGRDQRQRISPHDFGGSAVRRLATLIKPFRRTDGRSGAVHACAMPHRCSRSFNEAFQGGREIERGASDRQTGLQVEVFCGGGRKGLANEQQQSKTAETNVIMLRCARSMVAITPAGTYLLMRCIPGTRAEDPRAIHLKKRRKAQHCRR